MSEILIEGIRAYAYHGCIEEEALTGGYFSVDVSVKGDFSKAVETDDLKYAFDYVTVSKMVLVELRKRSHLIETVAYRILKSVKRHYPHAEHVKVKLTKERPPVEQDVQQVSVFVEE